MPLMDLRNDMVNNLIDSGIDVKLSITRLLAGVNGIDLRFAPRVKSPDQLLMFKYIVKKHGKKWNKRYVYAKTDSGW